MSDHYSDPFYPDPGEFVYFVHARFGQRTQHVGTHWILSEALAQAESIGLDNGTWVESMDCAGQRETVAGSAIGK